LNRQFNDSRVLSTDGSSASKRRKVTVNPRTGKKECVFVDVDAVYPNGMECGDDEFSFEELRAKKRGLLQKTWKPEAPVVEAPVMKRPSVKDVGNHDSTCHLNLPVRDPEPSVSSEKSITNLPQMVPLKDEANLSKKIKKDDKSNRTRKIRLVEVKAETQTVQINMDSPSGPKIRKKKNAEATMTIHTKAAMDDVYDMVNQTLSIDEPTIHEENEDAEEDDEDDDLTSVGESTGTGRISASASEFGDDVTGDYTMSSKTDADTSTRQTIDESEFSDFTGTSALDGTEDVHDDDASNNGDEDLSVVVLENKRPVISHTESSTEAEIEIEEVEGVTPVDQDLPEADYFEQSDYVMVDQMPYRTNKPSRLPFMTPIVEKTESSIGAATERKMLLSVKTPSRENHKGGFAILDLDDDTGIMSSPFEDHTQDNKENALHDVKISQPALPKLNKASEPLGENPKLGSAMKPKEPVAVLKVPIIQDLQCNPMDETIRNAIISQIRPGLESYQGFHQRKGSVSGKSVEIRKYIKAAGKPGTTAPLLDFPQSKRRFVVRRELGRGAFAPVYLVDSIAKEDSAENFTSNRRAQEVIKMEDPPSPWEFYIIRQAKRRLGVSRPSESIVEAPEMHLFADECFLIEEFRNQGTLLDAINLSRAESGGAMEEQLAMFFTIEIFRTVEALHEKGIIHGDLKADNVLIRLDECLSASSSEANSFQSQYRADGSGGWSEKGITLIDFGRGVDMRAFNPDVQFIADWKTTEADCAEMRGMRPWTYQVDYHGLAGIVHSLLFGKYMDTRAEGGSTLGAGSTMTYSIREVFKRYWQTEIWKKVFEVLLNPLMNTEPEDGKKLPLLAGLKDLREQMEKHLEANAEKGTGLKTMLRKLESSLRERRK
jgi:checkpoint serine/threonine-protein kinase